MSNPKSNSDFVSVETAAEILSVSGKTIRNWIKAGKLPAYSAGPKLLRINVLDIRAFCRPAFPVEWDTPRENGRSQMAYSARKKLAQEVSIPSTTVSVEAGAEFAEKGADHDLA